MTAAVLIVGILAALLVLKFIKGTIKFVLLAVLVLLVLFLGGLFD